MKKIKPKIQLLGENKETNQAIIMIPMALLPQIQELCDEDNGDYQIALKRQQDPKRKLVTLSQVKKELEL